MADTRALVERLFNEVINGGDTGRIDELVAADFIEHEEFPGMTPGRDSVKQFVEMVHSAFPDFRMNIEDVIVEGERAAIRSTMTGTHKGEFMGIAATGRTLSVAVIDIVRFADGKAVEHWGLTDSATMMEQLGIAPPA